MDMIINVTIILYRNRFLIGHSVHPIRGPDIDDQSEGDFLEIVIRPIQQLQQTVNMQKWTVTIKVRDLLTRYFQTSVESELSS